MYTDQGLVQGQAHRTLRERSTHAQEVAGKGVDPRRVESFMAALGD
jgi:hypothetical protein